MTILILTCDLCGADAGDDPYHATMNGNGHVHICKKCFDPHQHDVGVLKQQRDELLKALLDERDALTAEIERLAMALRLAKEHINDITPEWYSAGQRVLAEIRAALPKGNVTHLTAAQKENKDE